MKSSEAGWCGSAAGWLCASVLWAMPAPGWAQPAPADGTSRELASTGAAQSEAREAVARGTARFEQDDFAGAALEFERAYRLLPDGPRRHAVLNNLAVCHQRMHHHAEALELYERYLAEAEPLPEDRAEVERIVDGLRDLTGELRVTSNVPAQVWVDDQREGDTPAELRLSAGQHVLELRADGYDSERTGLTVRPRGVEELVIELDERQLYRGAPRVYFLTGAALTGALLVTGAALGGRTLGLHRQAEAGAQDGVTTVEDLDGIHRMAVATDVTLASAALFGVATVVLAFLTDFEQGGEREASAPVALGGAVGRGDVRLSLSGRF